MPKRYVTVDAVIVKENKILLVKRKFPPRKGYWALPGGFVERNETLKKAVVREVREETGLDVKPVNMIGLYDDPKRDARGNVTAAYLCDVVGGELKTSRETSEIRLFPHKEIPSRIAFDHSMIIKDTMRLIRW